MGQAEHYDAILDDYERHYFDESSMEYRRAFIYPALFNNLDLNGKDVVDLACASGLNSTECAKIYPRVRLQGVDISDECCASYRRHTAFPAHIVDLSSPAASLSEPCDTAFVVGGLHHCVNDLPATLQNMARFIKPGGHLLMVEPNAGFILNAVRNLWYKKDRWFRAEEEHPLFHDKILEMASGNFELIKVTYLGGPAYFLILNSLITRVPHRFKPLLAKPLMAIERLYNLLPGSAPFPMFIAQWRRR
nr:class I SAM-dependent methyltransferase [uncultured Gellertiella sp.]